MTRVSKRKIKDEDFKKIFDKFIEIIDISKSKKDTKLFIKEFLSSAERIMFAKRIGIIYMVIEKIPNRVIADTLSVSTSTIGRIIEKHDRGDYRYLDSIMKKNKESLLDIIEKIYFILPPRAGRKRYRFVRQDSFHI
jgi:Trp operon repressor